MNYQRKIQKSKAKEKLLYGEKSYEDKPNLDKSYYSIINEYQVERNYKKF